MDEYNSEHNDVTQRGQQARQQLLTAALTLFAENGLEGTSTRQIALEAKQNIGAIAYYFSSKDGLYLAVAGQINYFIQARFKALLAEVSRFTASQTCADEPERCLAYIKDIVGLFCRVLTNPKTLNFSRFILREQLTPTAAFWLIYKESLLPIHTNLTRLIAAYTGIAEDSPQAIVHAHAIIGETLSFRAGRETFLHRIDRQELGERETAIIEEILLEHTELILRGLRAKHRYNKQ